MVGSWEAKLRTLIQVDPHVFHLKTEPHYREAKCENHSASALCSPSGTGRLIMHGGGRSSGLTWLVSSLRMPDSTPRGLRSLRLSGRMIRKSMSPVDRCSSAPLLF